MSAEQIIFFEKNKVDLEKVSVLFSVTDAIAVNDGAAYLNNMRDRKNYTAWMTTESTDAANTVIDIDLGDTVALDTIILVGHNLKSYTLQYLSGFSYIDFSTPINPTNDTKNTSHYDFSQINTNNLRLTILGTKVANVDKQIRQFIATVKVGQLEGWPKITKPTISTNKQKTKMLSGKMRVVESLDSFACTLSVDCWKIQADIDIISAVYERREGVLIWINAGSEDQFSMDIRGYRPEDIYLVRPLDDWQPEFYRGIYSLGLKTSVDLAEVIT